MKTHLKILPVLFSIYLLSPSSFNIDTLSQVNYTPGSSAIHTSVPFLTIAPDSRGAAIGWTGAASEPDNNSQFWNAAKYAFADERAGISLSYTPWYSSVIPNIYLVNLIGYLKTPSRAGAFSGSFRYFSLSQIVIPTSPPTTYDQFEWSVDAGYSHKFTDQLSAGIVLRYIASELVEDDPASTISADLGVYHRRDLTLAGIAGETAFGLHISNLGPGMKYTDHSVAVPLPANLRMGARLSLYPVENHQVEFNLDLNKLLVPSPPVTTTDSITGNTTILYGYPEPSTTIAGMVQSFYDAPGVLRGNGSRNVLLEELRETRLNMGLEYLLFNKYSARIGYSYEHESKGVLNLFTAGLGFRTSWLGIDFFYFFPVSKESPVKNTYGLTISTDFRSR